MPLARGRRRVLPRARTRAYFFGSYLNLSLTSYHDNRDSSIYEHGYNRDKEALWGAITTVSPSSAFWAAVEEPHPRCSPPHFRLSPSFPQLRYIPPPHPRRRHPPTLAYPKPLVRPRLRPPRLHHHHPSSQQELSSAGRYALAPPFAVSSVSPSWRARPFEH